MKFRWIGEDDAPTDYFGLDFSQGLVDVDPQQVAHVKKVRKQGVVIGEIKIFVVDKLKRHREFEEVKTVQRKKASVKRVTNGDSSTDSE